MLHAARSDVTGCLQPAYWERTDRITCFGSAVPTFQTNLQPLPPTEMKAALSPKCTRLHGATVSHTHPPSHTISQTDSYSFNRRRFGRSAVTRPRPLLSAEIQTDSPNRRLVWNEAELRQRGKESVEPSGDLKCPNW